MRSLPDSAANLIRCDNPSRDTPSFAVATPPLPLAIFPAKSYCRSASIDGCREMLDRRSRRIERDHFRWRDGGPLDRPSRFRLSKRPARTSLGRPGLPRFGLRKLRRGKQGTQVNRHHMSVSQLGPKLLCHVEHNRTIDRGRMRAELLFNQQLIPGNSESSPEKPRRMKTFSMTACRTKFTKGAWSVG